MENNIDENSKIFNKENRIYKYYINNIEQKPEGIEFIKSLFRLELLKNDKTPDQDILQLYEILGFDKFFEVITFFSSKTIKIPNVEKIKKALITSIAYYQINILGLTPKDAGKILSEKLGVLNLKQKNVKAIIKQLQQDIDHLSDIALRKIQTDQVVGGSK